MHPNPAALSRRSRRAVGFATILVLPGSAGAAAAQADVVTAGRMRTDTALSRDRTIVDMAGGLAHSIVLRADGSAAGFGGDILGETSVPALPSGLVYTAVAASSQHGAALRSDGTCVAWGLDDRGQCTIAPPPAGLRYVEVAANDLATFVRRSDGEVLAFGGIALPALRPGQAFGPFDAHGHTFAAIVGPAQEYAAFGAGCAGSLGVPLLAHRGGLQLGGTLELEVQNLPLGAALLVTGLSDTVSSLGPLPFDLAALGMPGCLCFVSLDDVSLLLGAGTSASRTLAIASGAHLLGLRLFHQAVALDPAAGNALGATVSNAAGGRLGY